jgi:EmrB/QacA subfamily drug resistance transporter
LAQFVVVLDGTIVNVSLPTISRHLHFSPSSLSWVVNAYLLTFGGLLLLGGRMADLMGRRRVFVISIAAFGLASLSCGLAQTDTELVAFRAVQGAAGAFVAPAALSLILVTFTTPAERGRAFGLYGAVTGAAGAAGVLFGGILTEHVGWPWVFFVNVPIAALLVVATPRAVAESRTRVERPWRQVDVPGGLLGTAGLALLVYAFVQTAEHGWTSTRTLVLLVSALVLIGAFLAIEFTVAAPVFDPRILRDRPIAVGNLVGLALGASMLSSGFYLLSLYLQQVLGYSAQEAGLAFLPQAAVIGIASRVAARLVQRVGFRPVVVGGTAVLAGGLGWASTVGAGDSYLELLGPLLLTGIGVGLSLVGVNEAATSGVASGDAGRAGGILTASQRVGGALGLAVLASVAYGHTADRARAGVSRAAALADGYDRAFMIAAILVAAAAVLAAFGLPSPDRPGRRVAADAAADPADGRPWGQPEGQAAG